VTEALDTLLNVNTKENRDAYAKTWSENGGKVIGYLCAYVPEELIQAAGMLPYRVMGSWWEPTPVSEGYLPATSCPFCRTVLEDVLKGKYAFLDGVATTSSCRIMTRLYDHWENYGSAGFSFMLDLPHKDNQDSVDVYTRHLMEFKGKLEEYSGNEITAETLGQAIEAYNRTRELLRSLYEMRKEEEPLISGSECLSMVLASMVMPRPEYNELLERAIVELEERDLRFEGDARILVSGNILSNPEEIRNIEEQGGLVVADDLCTGTRYFWDMAQTGGDLEKQIANLSARYLRRTPCARMFDNQKRYDFIKQMVEDYDVQGVIYTALKYCDPFVYNYPQTRTRLEEMDVPVLRLEREYSMMGAGQTSTRVGAFLEMLS
jgi:bzd-type benzoyl-CoA reductase N subunit